MFIIYFFLMNKSELVAAMVNETNLAKKDVEAVLNSFMEVVTKELQDGEKVQLVGFGTFEVAERAARTGRNPHIAQGATDTVLPGCWYSVP